MEVLNKDDLNYKIKNRDYKIVKDHLIEVEKRSHGSFRNRKGVVLECLNFINKDLKDIKTYMVKTYFETVLDRKDIQHSSKKTYRSNLNSFLSFHL